MEQGSDSYGKEAGHLSDMDFSVLLSGLGFARLREGLMDHLAACEDCMQRLAAARRLEADERTRPSDIEEGAGPLPDRVRSALLDGFLSAGIAPHAPSRVTPRVLQLRTPAAWLHEPDEGMPVALAWAADAPPAEMDGELPVLTSEDGRIRVRFRRTDGEGLPRAYVLAPDGWPIGGVSLHVPSRRLSFALRPDGTADLRGVQVSDLKAGVLELRLGPERPEAPPPD